MSTFGRANATGRSSGKLSAQDRKLIGPPPNQPWTWLPRALMQSEAWRGMSYPCRRFIDFLMIEHCNHAGLENGHLQATYYQLSSQGISRKRIASAIREAVDRGLVEVTRRGGLYGLESRRTTSRYRLTWVGTLKPACTATNEWLGFKSKTKSPSPQMGTVCTGPKQRKAEKWPKSRVPP